MPNNYSKHVGTRTKATNAASVPQTSVLPGRGAEMSKNHAGGFSFDLDKWKRLDRFLILGSEGGTFYATERDLTKENFSVVKECVTADGVRVVNRVVEISEAGRAPKNDPALLVLALCMASDDITTKSAAFAAINRVARTGTHFLHLVSFAQSFRGWGRAMRDGFARWYLSQSPMDLAFQVTKYPSRDGFAHRDVLALTHAHSLVKSVPVADRADMDLVLRYATWGYKGLAETGAAKAIRKANGGEVAEYLGTIEALKSMDPEAAASTIVDKNLPREVLPTELLNHPVVWEALLQNMPVTALVRNLGNLTKHGVVAPMSDGAMKVIETLTDDAKLAKSRIHPIQILAALMTYEQGKGMKGSSTWTPVQPVVSALNRAFYATFGNVPETSNDFFGLDISGSMFGNKVNGMDYLDAATASAALALVSMNRSKNYHVMGFTEKFEEVAIAPDMRLDKVVAVMERMSSRMGSTDCSLPMKYAMDNNLKVKTFYVYTDSETGSAGAYGMGYGNRRYVRGHPSELLKQYRQTSGIDARLVVVGMCSNGFTIADPKDAGMLDVVGFDTATPNIIANFANGAF